MSVRGAWEIPTSCGVSEKRATVKTARLWLSSRGSLTKPEVARLLTTAPAIKKINRPQTAVFGYVLIGQSLE